MTDDFQSKDEPCASSELCSLENAEPDTHLFDL